MITSSCSEVLYPLITFKRVFAGFPFQSYRIRATELQKALLDYDRNHKDTSYICEPWFDMYLRSRVPCPVNFNPFMMYAPDPNAQFNHQLSRASNFAVSFARFKRALDANILAPEVFHLNPKKSDTKLFRNVCKALPSSLSWFGAVAFNAFPLDMSQYKSLFNATRIPKKDRDILYQDVTQKHFMVLCRGRIYVVDIFDDQGNILPAECVHNSLAHILQNAKQQDADKCTGSLTSLDRDSWAKVRDDLLEAGNSQNLQLIDGALFTLCLDDLKSQEPERLIQSLLIGDDASNRWFDKSFQLIVDGNGQATINFEHSWGDGVAVLRLMEESYKDTNTHHFVTPDTQPQSADPSMVRELEFHLTDLLRFQITEAQKVHVTRNSGLDFATMEYAEMTKDTIKKSKMSPDSIMQLAIQMAFYSIYKEMVPTYESCSTAAFLKGRTDCMRSDFSGQAFDRHLLGLKISAERLGMKTPALFEDPGYLRMGHFVLSTSTLSTNTIVFGGFGPVVEDGLGIGYNVSSSRMGAVISSHKKNRDAKEFSQALVKSLDILRNIIMNKMGEQNANRPEMVEAAKKFMLTPKVRDTPFEEQRQFLIGKGVTESEIEEARASVPVQMTAHGGSAAHNASFGPAPSSPNRVLSFAQSMAMFGCVSYAGYRFLRSYILPRFFDIPDPASEDVRQLQEGISTIKSLLLSHNNFAPIIAPTAKAAQIPSWQRQQNETSPPISKANSGYTTPPANYDDGTEEHGVLDGFYMTPLNDSDMPQRSRISFLSTEMTEAKQMGVRGLSCYGFRMMDGSFLYGPVALFPKTALSWRVQTPDDITPRSLCLFAMLEPKIDILVIGAGDKKNIDKVRAQIAGFLREHRIGLEITDTEDAIATFNFLNADGRYVAAGLYPPDDMVVTDAEYGRAMNLLKGWDEVDENPLLMGFNDTFSRTGDLIHKMWSGKGDFEKVRRRLLAPPEEREAMYREELEQLKQKKLTEKTENTDK
ncbi:hypothetical protein GCK32_003551 [Trichostrongylus colubriformis]|uniref:NADH dehydrogenase [ubiquinone] 1 alpha subcomplex assembly factor 3 n=1 Tax=Trichostrongylus colubriformis TaxID=6319 RepID=A0AAN8EMZ0_TRICO